MDILPYGDHAILINFENKIDIQVNHKVVHLSDLLHKTKPRGFQYCIPAYCSITIVYDPMITTYEQLKIEIDNLEISIDSQTKVKGREITIPVCYAKQFAPDLESFANSKALSTKEIIDIHCSQTYHVYMLGFLPGFAYLGKSPASISAKRHNSPRLKVPSGSVGLAGLQTAIYPCESPGGWQLIGRTPVKIFNEIKENPFLFEVGDKVRFQEIEKDKYKEIEANIILDKFDIESLIHVGN